VFCVFTAPIPKMPPDFCCVVFSVRTKSLYQSRFPAMRAVP
jgi:hypothetical protein